MQAALKGLLLLAYGSWVIISFLNLVTGPSTVAKTVVPILLKSS